MLRVAFIQASNESGSRCRRSADALATLPDNRTPNRKDWSRLSQSWRSRLDDEIAWLERLRDDLDGCIGCGCLSLSVCALQPRRSCRSRGPGPRILMGRMTSECLQPIGVLARASQP